MDEIILVGYGVGWLLAIRPIARWLTMDVNCWTEWQPELVDGEDLAFGLGLGVLAASFWPLLGAGWLVRRSFHRLGRERAATILLGGEPRARKRERLKRVAAARTERLERELGIGPYAEISDEEFDSRLAGWNSKMGF